MPSWPEIAIRVHSCLASAASVATTASVVLSGRIGQRVGAVGGDVGPARRADVVELAGEPRLEPEQLAGADVEHVAAASSRATRAADGDAVGEHDARRADAALEPFGVGAGAGADGALRDRRRAGRRRRTLAERGVRAVVEAAADAEVEQHGRRHDRHDVVRLGADGEADGCASASQRITPSAAASP